MNINSIKFTTYNVDNLFDSIDDPYKDDGPPKSEKGKAALAEVLKRLDSDIVALQEVENKQIIEEVLSLAGLKDRYNIIVGKSDGRGIACALLIDKRFPIKSYTINENEKTFYRPPVEAVIELAPSFPVKIMGVHFKAKMDPKSTEQRIKEAKRTIELAKKDNIPTIIMGDYNDLPESQTSKLFEINGFTDVRQVDKQSPDTSTPTHFSIYEGPREENSTENIYDYINDYIGEKNKFDEKGGKPSIIDYIRITDNLKKYVVQGSFDVLEKNEDFNTAVASDHRPVSVVFNIANNNYSKNI